MELLNSISEMGSRPGISRYLTQSYNEGETLQSTLAALHDCISSSRNVTVKLGQKEVQGSAGVEDNMISVDMMFKIADLSNDAQKSIKKQQKITAKVKQGEASKHPVDLRYEPMDVMFQLVAIERTQPATMNEVDVLQQKLNSMSSSSAAA